MFKNEILFSFLLFQEYFQNIKITTRSTNEHLYGDPFIKEIIFLEARR